ncbi:hypothetical protein B9Z55_001698 [Caenorhabditis nigoni]|uniref:F-box domain-containing protein n=1 Tax=Caenorhabditis nigoni TaxID=1611254 RepID=A0A2G5VGV1_9PELO|nr:hypothetical protein B9Z55_001698 [Caenorhabditis nigoni]
MPISLLKLPSVIRDEVFRNSKCSHLFQLSLCSLRLRKYIERVKFTIPKLRYEVTEDRFLVGILRDVCHIETIATIEEVICTDQQIKELALLKDVKIGDGYYMPTKFHLRIGTNEIPHIFMAVAEINGRMQSELQKHVTSLFDYCGSNKLKIDIEELSNKLPNVVNVRDSVLEGWKVDMSVIDAFFKRFPNHRSANIKATINGELPENSALFDIQHISFGNQSSYYFQRFRGRNLVFHKAKLDTSYIIDFLSKWVHSIAYHDLETLTVLFNLGFSISKGSILEAFETKQYDSLNPLDWPESFLCDPKIIGYRQRHIPLRNEMFFEIKRKNDGRKGYINFEDGDFELFVPNITE